MAGLPGIVCISWNGGCASWDSQPGNKFLAVPPKWADAGVASEEMLSAEGLLRILSAGVIGAWEEHSLTAMGGGGLKLGVSGGAAPALGARGEGHAVLAPSSPAGAAAAGMDGGADCVKADLGCDRFLKEYL